jgi:Tfp pilus assembly PilM family ATPase
MASFRESLGKLSVGTKRFAAVDFDGRQLRVVHAERVGNRTRVLKLAAVATPEHLDQQSPKAFGGLLGRTLRDMRLSNVGVLMNVPRGLAVLKPVTLPAGTPQTELAGMVQFQMEKELPFRTEEAVIDFTVESHYDVEADQAQAPSVGIDMLVGAVRLPVVDQYRQIAEAAGVKLLRLGLRPYANMRCVDACTRRGPGESLLVVHLTADETEIDVLVGKSLSFSRSAAVKIPAALADPAERGQSVRSVVMEVVRSVQSYQAVERGFRADAILVAGGTGVEADVAAELGRRLGVRCELFDPAGALQLGDVENASAFVAALGLAIGHSGAEQLPFDFLNPKRPRVRRNVRRIASVCAAVAVVLVLAGGITAGAVVLGGKQAEVDRLRAKRDAKRKLSGDLKRLESRVAAIRQWNAESREWIRHWAYLSALLPPCTDAYISALKTTSDGWISFTLKARDSKVITDLDKRLNEAGYTFKLKRLATASDSYGYPYNADVQVYVDTDAKIDLASVRPPPRPSDDDSVGRLMQTASTGGSRGSPRDRREGRSGRPGEGSRGPDRPSGSGRPPSPSPAPTGGGPAAATLEQVRQEITKAVDRNGDGQVDRKEAYRVYDVARKQHWRHWDANRNGELDKSERYVLYGWIRKTFYSRR